MATDLSLLPLAQLKKLAQQHGWNSLRWPEDGGDTWEDARGAWPQRSYACSFCSREFRSAQALGGHMNVHRRDRARLRQAPQRPNTCSYVQTSHATMADSPSTLLSMSPPCPPATDPPSGSHVHHASLHVGDGSEIDELDLELRLGW